MRVPKATYKTNGLVVLVAVVGLVFGAAGPAVADDYVVAGAGAGTGWEYPNEVMACGLPTTGVLQDAGFHLSHYGSYTTLSADPNSGPPVTVSEYLGPIDFFITVERHIAAPQGVVAANSCAGPLDPVVPGIVEITDVRVSGSTGSLDFPPSIPPTEAGVRCEMTGNPPGTVGGYTRVSEAVVFIFTVECDISANVLPSVVQEVQNVDITHVIEGTMTPCSLVPPIGFPTNPVCDIRTGEDGGSHLETVHEAASVLGLP